MWLSDSQFTNDSEENTWSLGILKGQLPELIPSLHAQEHLEFFKRTRLPPHIACFSEQGDLLSQWRAYADDGSGFSIGMDPNRLGIEIGHIPLSWNAFPAGPAGGALIIDRETALVPIIYEKGAQEFHINAVCASFHSALKKAATEGERANARVRLQMDLYTLSLQLKKPGFFEEREWRIVGEEAVKVQGGSIETLSGGCESGRPRFDLRDLGNGEPIVELLLGPRNEWDESHARRFLDEHGMHHVIVSRSSQSYRRPPRRP